MITRYTFSAGTAGLITLGLLIVMARMIATGRPVVLDAERYDFTPFVFEPRDEIPVEKTLEKPTRPASEPPPARTRIGPGETERTSILINDPASPVLDRGPVSGRVGPSDGDLLPIVKVQPAYPAGALARNLEGWVVVEFTVNRAGNVEDVRVAESSHTIFERAAVEAAAHFRYRPRIIDGEAVRVTGVRNIMRFEIDGGARR